MTKTRAKFAARLAAREFGIPRQVALELIHFWFDEGLMPDNIPVEILARGIGEYVASSAA